MHILLYCSKIPSWNLGLPDKRFNLFCISHKWLFPKYPSIQVVDNHSYWRCCHIFWQNFIICHTSLGCVKKPKTSGTWILRKIIWVTLQNFCNEVYFMNSSLGRAWKLFGHFHEIPASLNFKVLTYSFVYVMVLFLLSM